MGSRAARVTVVLLLVAAGAGAGVFLWDVDRRLERVEDGRANVDAALEAMMGAATEIARVQQEYVAGGRPDESALSRAAVLLDNLRADARGLTAAARSSDRTIRITALDGGIATLADLDGRVRDHVALEQLSAAADLAAGAALDAADDLTDRLAQLRSAERAAARAERRLLQSRQQQVLAGVAIVWVAGLLLLVRRPKSPPAVSAAPVEPPTATHPPVLAPSVDLTEAAAVCTAIAQVTSTEPLPALLARAAAVIDAPGIVVWMGAGEDLFAVTGHGYDARVLGRLGPIRRQADNATAAAWRTGGTRIVAADTMSNGAIVAPMIGPGGCIGVLAAEVRRGREIDPAVQATTSIIAAQLATVLAAWPQASAEPLSSGAATTTEARLHA
jgi:hypothetical protein